VPVTASPAIPVPAGHACAPKAVQFCPPQNRARRTGKQRGCIPGNPRPPKTMRPISINRQSSARPITSPKNGLSRWSRQRRTTLTAPDTINGPGALILTIPDFASVRISVAASAAMPGRYVPACPEPRDGRSKGSAGVTACRRVGHADGRRHAATNAPGPGARWPGFAHQHGGAKRAFVQRRKQGRRVSGPAWLPLFQCAVRTLVNTPAWVKGCVTYAIQTLRASVKGNCVPHKENATAFS
jgi:hypothetical protein